MLDIDRGANVLTCLFNDKPSSFAECRLRPHVPVLQVQLSSKQKENKIKRGMVGTITEQAVRVEWEPCGRSGSK